MIGSRSTTRRTTLFALLAAGMVALSGCDAWLGGEEGGGTPDDRDSAAEPPNAVKPAGNGKARCDGVAIAYLGPIDGGDAEPGADILRGVELAVQEHNRANGNCLVELKEFETEGAEKKAAGIARLVVNADEIVGVVGLPHVGESKAAGGIFAKDGLVQITPSATSSALSDQGWMTFFRGVGNDAAQGEAAAELLSDELRKRKVCVVHDGSESASAQADAVRKALGGKVACQERLTGGKSEAEGVANKIAKAGPDGIYLAGSGTEMPLLAKELFEAGSKADVVASDGVMAGDYATKAGGAAKHTYFACPCVPHERFPAFTAKYREEFGVAPGAYSIEGYDAATVLLSGIDKGKQDRESLLAYVDEYGGQGLSKRFEWQDNGELKKQPAVWTYKIVNGKIVRHAEIK